MLASTCAGNAALVIYEGFDYALADGATLNGVATNTTGFSGNYVTTGGGTIGTTTYATTGLTFGDNHLAGTAGAVRISVASGTNSAVLSATVASSAQTGTLWSSYLVSFESKATTNNPTAQARLTAGGGGNRFNTLADSGSNLATGISYDATATTSGGTTLTVGDTYLMLSQYTNVGTAGGGTATLWIFDLAGYDAWFAAGSLEGDLGTHALASQTASAATQQDFNPGALYQFAVSNASGSAAVQTVVYDELRWGTEMSDVVGVIPEPSTAVVMTGGLAMLAFRRRRPAAVTLN